MKFRRRTLENLADLVVGNVGREDAEQEKR